MDDRDIKKVAAQIPSNSKKSKLNPVVKTEDIVSKNRTVDNLSKSFIKEDIRDIGNYVLFDLIIPGVKDTILNMLEMAFFGSSSRNRRNGNRSYNAPSYYNYSSASRYNTSYYNNGRAREARRMDYKNIILRNKMDADEVVRRLHERIRESGAASISDLYELMGMDSNWNDHQFGWVEERDIGVRHVSNGWLIDVSDAYSLN